eukprot:PhM_4_TR2751/c0_g1_i1/m.83854/K10862/TDP1; tyrosyl-DNA phosphodiesterase 1
MTDIPWVFSQCPSLRDAARVVVVTGDQALVDKTLFPNVTVLHPKLPLTYGTHHTKAAMCFSTTGLRVTVHTANYIHADWAFKTQAIWVQDFPLRPDALAPSSGNNNSNNNVSVVDYDPHGFGAYLRRYFAAVAEGRFDTAVLNRYDFRNATVDLVGSVPGYHQGDAVKHWGLGRLAALDRATTTTTPQQRDKLLCQFSSMGSLDDKWVSAFCPGVSATDVRLVFPTVAEVATSLEGWRAGFSIPVPSKNHKPFLRGHMHRWQSREDSPQPRSLAMPHIKSYVRYNASNNDIRWAMFTSSNLSKAAWGQYQKQDTQLCIRSYELGVFFRPPRLASTLSSWGSFSCTPHDPITLPVSPVTEFEYSFGGVARLSLPYSLAPVPYTADDEPWCVDVARAVPDVLGFTYPVEDVSYYGTEAAKAPHVVMNSENGDENGENDDRRKGATKRGRSPIDVG